MQKLVKNACDKVDYYGNMKPRFLQYYEEDIAEQVSILRQMLLTARKYERNELKDRLNLKVQEYLQRYYAE